MTSPTSTRRAVLAAIAASTVPLVAIPALAAPGDDAELLRLHAELRPLALAYGKLGERWHEAEHDFHNWLAGHGLTDEIVHAAAGIDKWFDLRRRHGVEGIVEDHNEAGEAMDVVLEAINMAPATTAAGVRIKLDATLLAIGTKPRLVFADPDQEWVRERIEDFLDDVRALLNEGVAA